ncbi:XrtX-associated membrane protein [Hymenobacter sp. IS2118]|uniref:XrtX-associated membrane protein n=1 Tax=Hymenobacter sp. IS2118 TaxID=1505605 RepID=UPI000558A429|nr:hypothetical protein [Hymenobacter sp. IS2118]
MTNDTLGVPRPPERKFHWVTIGTLALALVLLDIYSEPVLQFLVALWQKAVAALGLSQQANVLQGGSKSGIARRFLPAVATYAALYLALCLLLLRALLPLPAHWRLVLRLYCAVLVVYVALVLLAKAANAAWAYKLSREIADFVVSPIPVVGLYLLFRASLGINNPAPENKSTTINHTDES